MERMVAVNQAANKWSLPDSMVRSDSANEEDLLRCICELKTRGFKIIHSFDFQHCLRQQGVRQFCMARVEHRVTCISSKHCGPIG